MSKPYVFETTKYFILLALAGRPSHAYALSDQIIGDSVGGVYLRPSTMAYALKRLAAEGLIELWEGADIHAGRKTYRLTAAGKRQLATAAGMHERAARLAKARL